MPAMTRIFRITDPVTLNISADLPPGQYPIEVGLYNANDPAFTRLPLTDGGVEVWAGLGYGGQALLVLPEYDVVAVANSWNVFGPAQSVIFPLVQALIQSVQTGD